jgi:hypothetical protein
MSVEALRAQLASQIAEPVITEGMTRTERRAAWDHHDADFQAQCARLDEEHLLLGIGRSAAVCMTHELIFSWQTATADRWFRALPERYMTPDSMTRPDWDHSHYPHDKHGRIGRVTTLQRPEPEPGSDEAQQIELVRAILANIAREDAEDR